MNSFAHVVDGIVRGALFTPPEGHDLAGCFTEALAAEHVPVPDDVAVAEGWSYDGSAFAPPAGDLPADQLAVLKSDLSAAVDVQAERLRLRMITPGSGQAMEYQEAYAEAVQVEAALKASPAATFDPAGFPMLAASMGCSLDPQTGAPSADIAGEARAVLAAYDAYQRGSAAIRSVRLRAKAAIAGAGSRAAVEAAYVAIAWPAIN